MEITKKELIKLVEIVVSKKLNESESKYNYSIQEKAKMLPNQLSSLTQTAKRLAEKNSFSHNDEAIITKMYDNLVDIRHEISRVNM